MNAIETQIEHLHNAVSNLTYAADNTTRHLLGEETATRRNLLYCDILAIKRAATAAERAFEAYDAARRTAPVAPSPLLNGSEPAATLAEVRTSVHELATK